MGHEDNRYANVPLYADHPGTIKIAGATSPKGAGWCAFRYLQKSLLPIDFMCIGANANQQATKAMGIFCFIVNNAEEFNTVEVAFQPLMFRTSTTDPITKQVKDKSVTIWRTLILEKKAK